MHYATLNGKTRSNISFGKVISSPTPFSWSNVYNAGKLFAVLALEKNNQEEHSDTLNLLGKTLLSKLEEEFFTLDTKDFPSIQQAILNTFKDKEQTIKYSFAASFFSDNKLYIFVIGDAAVFIKRDGKIAKFEASLEGNTKSVASFSGHSLNNDLIVLTTDSNYSVLEEDVFLEDKSPEEIAESLTSIILGKQDSKICLIIVRYTEQTSFEKEETQELKKTESKNEEEMPKEEKNYNLFLKGFKKFHPLKGGYNLISIKLTHSKKVFLTIAIIVASIFVLSVYFTIQKQQSERVHGLFQNIYPEAEKKYNEGNSLLPLNKNVAKQFFLESKKILDQAKSKFPKNSKEEKRIADLLQKVEDAISLSSGINLVDAKEIDAKESVFLSLQTKKQKQAFAQDETNIYFADESSVYSVIKKDAKENEIIKNSDSWQDITALGIYFGNIYVLDKSQNRILKFAPIQGGFEKSNYLPNGVSPSFTNAVSMAIDGSIFVLSNDGTIQKFTRGNTDQFTISGLDTPFASPSKIFTDRHTSNIYVLDNGNSRIVVINKEGIYQNQYQAEVLRNAKDFEVLEKDKKVYILSQGKVYEIEIK